MKHTPFDINDTENVRVAVYLRNGEEYIGGYPVRSDPASPVVGFWFENDLVFYPLDLVKKVVYYSIKKTAS